MKIKKRFRAAIAASAAASIAAVLVACALGEGEQTVSDERTAAPAATPAQVQPSAQDVVLAYLVDNWTASGEATDLKPQIYSQIEGFIGDIVIPGREKYNEDEVAAFYVELLGSNHVVGLCRNTGGWKIINDYEIQAVRHITFDAGSGEGVPDGAKRIAYRELEFYVTGYTDSRAVYYLDNDGTPYEFVEITVLPGAQLHIEDPGMSPGDWHEDGKPHPQWGLSYDETTTNANVRLDGSVTVVPITESLVGIYNLEASLCIAKFVL